MNFNNVLVETIESLAWLTINRPVQLNALNLETIGEIAEAMGQLAADPAVRAIAITGAGEKAFVAGADIAAMQGMSAKQAEAFASQGHRCMRSIEECGKAVIAAVNGFALGGGTELALACDIIYAAETAKFGLPEVKLGLYPGFGGTQRLPRLVGPARAREMIFTGRILSAAQAQEIGLVGRIVPAAELRNEVTKLAREIMAGGPVAVALAKKLIRDGMNLSLTDALENERVHFSKVFETQDHAEGLSAFLEKRAPVFTGQ